MSSSKNKITDHPTVLLGCALGEKMLDVVVELAARWGWRLLDLKFMGGGAVSDVALSGALIDALPGSALATQLRERGCPAVRLGRFVHPEDHLLPAVLPDIERAGQLAAEHFAERRFKDLAFVSWQASSPGVERYPLFRGFCERAAAMGVKVHVHEFHVPDDANWGPVETEKNYTARLGEWLDGVDKPLGIFTTGDGVAMRIWSMCHSRGIAVPQSVAILGYGNMPLCPLLPVPLSSVDPDPLARVREAMGLLRRLIRGEAPPAEPVMVSPSGIVERESTDALALHDPMVVRAVGYIWAHIADDPTVDEVANALGVSRRTLERVFRQDAGHGIKAEIRCRRLRIYCRELRSSEEPIVTLSSRMGWRSTEAMHRQFRKAMGTTPSQYRRAPSI